MGKDGDCLGCGQKFKQKDACVQCSICGLWSHKTCSGLTTEFFNCMAEQIKATGHAYWACRACSNYAAGMNHRIKEVQEQAQEKKGELLGKSDTDKAAALFKVMEIHKRFLKIMEETRAECAWVAALLLDRVAAGESAFEDALTKAGQNKKKFLGNDFARWAVFGISCSSSGSETLFCNVRDFLLVFKLRDLQN